MSHVVTLVPGDGIGPEVMGAAVRVLEATGVDIAWDVQQVGVVAVAEGREPLPSEALSAVRRTGIALKGPVTTSTGKRGFPSVNVALRRELDLYAQVRRCRAVTGGPSLFDDVDLAVIRETTEDLYAGVEFPAASEGAESVVVAAKRLGRGRIPSDAGLSIKFTTKRAVRRILEFAFDYTRRQGRRRLTVVHKATVMRCTDGMYLDLTPELAARFPEVDVDTIQVDNLCGQLVRRPQDFDVLVMGIQYGDIVSDLGAGLVGGIGTVPGVNFGPGVTMFEPAHGTLPGRAGRDQADPTAAILCGAMLLDHLGEHEASTQVQRAVASVVAEGDAVTYDLRKPADARPVVGTTAMADAVIAAIERGSAGR